MRVRLEGRRRATVGRWLGGGRELIRRKLCGVRGLGDAAFPKAKTAAKSRKRPEGISFRAPRQPSPRTAKPRVDSTAGPEACKRNLSNQPKIFLTTPGLSKGTTT